MDHIVKAKWQQDMHYKVDAPGGELSIDAAEDFGGTGKGNRAKPLMLASLAGCTGIDILSLVKKMRIDIDDLSIEVSAVLAEEHPKIYTSTHIVYNFHGKNLDEEKIIKAVQLSFDKYCGVIAMFKSFSTVTKAINFIQS